MNELSATAVELFDAVARHGELGARGDVGGQRKAEADVTRLAARLDALADVPEVARLDGPPPRHVALAMARALFSAPHLSRTLSVYTTQTENTIFQPDEPMADALGLPVWQLEEVRDEVDLHVSRVLKQVRALNWLWHRAGNPRVAPGALFEALFPGATHPVPTHFTNRGCRLYGVFPQEVPPPLEALYLPWLPGSGRWTCLPDAHFSARYLDDGLVRSLTRAIGATGDEARDLLDELVCAVPAGDEAAFVHHDRWRSEGWSAVTGLGAARPGGAWLTLPLAADAIGPEDWLERTDQGLALRGPRRVFDRHATTRVTSVVHGLYVELCARLLTGRAEADDRQVVLFDLDTALRRVLRPLADWTADPRAHASLATAVGATPDHVALAMGQVRAAWDDAARGSWNGAPTAERPWTVRTVLAVHLAVTRTSLRRAWTRPPDPRAAHHRILLPFFAAAMAQAPLSRLWKPVDGRLPPPEDLVGTWFWGTWLRVLDAAQIR